MCFLGAAYDTAQLGGEVLALRSETSALAVDAGKPEGKPVSPRNSTRCKSDSLRAQPPSHFVDFPQLRQKYCIALLDRGHRGVKLIAQLEL